MRILLDIQACYAIHFGPWRVAVRFAGPAYRCDRPFGAAIAGARPTRQNGAMFDWTDAVTDLIPDAMLWALGAAVLLLLAVLILWVELG